MSSDEDEHQRQGHGPAPQQRGKMAVPPDSELGLELDSKGNPIPFDQRTEDDKEKAVGKA
jgi:hypothetical protein